MTSQKSLPYAANYHLDVAKMSISSAITNVGYALKDDSPGRAAQLGMAIKDLHEAWVSIDSVKVSAKQNAQTAATVGRS